MKTFFKVILSLFVIGALCFVGYFVWFNIDKDAYYDSVMHGSSMNQYGVNNEDPIRVYWNQECKVGDFCHFECKSEKCRYPQVKSLVKKLDSIDENGCHFFVGNPEPWMENGLIGTSVDSRTFGCLMPGEFEKPMVVRW